MSNDIDLGEVLLSSQSELTKVPPLLFSPFPLTLLLITAFLAFVAF